MQSPPRRARCDLFPKSVLPSDSALRPLRISLVYVSHAGGALGNALCAISVPQTFTFAKKGKKKAAESEVSSAPKEEAGEVFSFAKKGKKKAEPDAGAEDEAAKEAKELEARLAAERAAKASGATPGPPRRWLCC